jgi:hypothetical protein
LTPLLNTGTATGTTTTTATVTTTSLALALALSFPLAFYGRYGYSSYMLVRPAELVSEIPKVQSDLTMTPDEFVNMLVFNGHWVTCQWPQNHFSLFWQSLPKNTPYISTGQI